VIIRGIMAKQFRSGRNNSIIGIYIMYMNFTNRLNCTLSKQKATHSMPRHQVLAGYTPAYKESVFYSQSNSRPGLNLSLGRTIFVVTVGPSGPSVHVLDIFGPTGL